MTKPVSIAVGIVCLSLATGTARAQSWPATDPTFATPPVLSLNAADLFGNAGQIVLSTNLDLDFVYTNIKPPGNGDSLGNTELRLVPALDYFIARNFAVGGAVLLMYETGKPMGVQQSQFAFGLAPEVGYNITISTKSSFFIKAGMSFVHVSNKLDSPSLGNVDTSGWKLGLMVSAPVVFHLAPHFFIGFGPAVSLDLISKVEGDAAAKTRTVGLMLDIGGWI